MSRTKRIGVTLILIGSWIGIVGYLSSSYYCYEFSLVLSHDANIAIPYKLILSVGITFVFAGAGILLLFKPTKSAETVGDDERTELGKDAKRK